MTECKYHCGTSLRRQRVLDSIVDMGGGQLLNGIDFVEVLDSAAPTGKEQMLLDLAFLKPDGVATLDRQKFAITGGTRITGIKVLSVAVQPDGKTLRLELDQAGDFSPYTLALRQGPENVSPPANMDRQLAKVTFSFKVECPSEFDCAEEPAPTPPQRQGPFKSKHVAIYLISDF